jgi:hypothetical protein
MSAITRHELEDLQRLVRQREKVLKSAAKQRSAELLADFENQMGQRFRFDQDEVWAEASKVARAAVARANEQIKARCREIGIPDRFAPVEIGWRFSGQRPARRITQNGRDSDRSARAKSENANRAFLP